MKNELEKIKEEFAARLNLAMDKKNYPVRGRARILSKEFGVSDKGAGKWINGDAIPETSKIPLIAAFLGISAEWLLSGVGDIQPAQPQNSQAKPPKEVISNILRKNASNPTNEAAITAALDKFLETLNKANQEQKLSSDIIKHLDDTLAFALRTLR